jgi:hypothetical protein
MDNFNGQRRILLQQGHRVTSTNKPKYISHMAQYLRLSQFSSSHIFGTLGIPATSGLAIGLVAGLVKS